MPILKIGADFINGNEVPIYLVNGNAARDAELAPVNGKDHARVSVAAKTFPDGSTMFVNVNGWRSVTADVGAIRKMDNVLAIGTLKSREYNGKKYYDLDATFVCISGVGRLRVPPSNRPKSAGDAVDVSAEDFDELPEDECGDLPL